MLAALELAGQSGIAAATEMEECSSNRHQWCHRHHVGFLTELDPLPQQVGAGALNAITIHTGGHVLLSGPLSPAIDDSFRLQKYFLQVLAGVSNTNVVTDPSGTIFRVQRFAFRSSSTKLISIRRLFC